MNKILSMIVFFLFTSCSMQKVMFVEYESLENYEQTVNKITENLRNHNWVVSNISNRQEYYRVHGFEIGKMTTIDICKPESSYKIMKLDKNKRMSPMAPMRVSVYEKENGKTYFSCMKLNMMKRFTHGMMKKMMKESATDLNKSIAPLIKK